MAGIAVAVTVLRPRSWWSAVVASLAAAVAIALGRGAPGPALAATGPMIGFLLAAVLACALVVRLGLAAWLARHIHRAAGGRPLALFALVCVATALATAAVSLDGAVVLLVPVALELARRGAQLRALLLGIVAVANAFSLGLPEGNPTNLVVLERLGGGLGAYAERALPAAAVAALLCAVGVGWLERRSLRGGGADPGGAAGVVRIGAAAGSVLRLGVQLSALLVLLIPIGARVHVPLGAGLPALLATAGATAAAAGLANNLPASAAVASALGGPAAYAALAGVSVGALASEHGSVATLLAGDLAGSRAFERRLVPVAAVALTAAVAVLWLGGR